MKRMSVLRKNVENFIPDSLESIIDKIKETSSVKFDESIDLSIETTINPKKGSIRGFVEIPHGKTNQKIILALTENPSGALNAGADFAGFDDMLDKIKDKGVFFDICLVESSLFKKILPISKILGQAKVMPNLKDGTVTSDLVGTIRKFSEGKICNYKSDSNGGIRLSIGKISMKTENLVSNIKTVVKSIITESNSIKKIVLSSTMGAGLLLPFRFTV